MDNKEKIKEFTEQLLEQSIPHMKEKIEKALKCGALPISSWDENINPMILPKIILCAVLAEEINQFNCAGTCFEKQVKKEVKNLSCFL